jgi:hypothetical protein
MTHTTTLGKFEPETHALLEETGKIAADPRAVRAGAMGRTMRVSPSAVVSDKAG